MEGSSLINRTDGKSHADRKFEKKMKFYELVRGAVAKKAISKEKQQSTRSRQNRLKEQQSTRSQQNRLKEQQRTRSRQKKLKAYDLSFLSEYLPELKSPTESGTAEFKINSKSRNKLLLKENNQLKTVMNHPIYQSDPLGAIYQHLRNTQPAVEEKLKIKNSRTGKNKTKKKKSKVQAMEI